MIPKDRLDLQYLIAVLRRRFWFLIVPFFLLTTVSVVYCILAPKTYRSTTLILVQPQKVPSEFVRSTVTSDVQSRLNTITEEITSLSKMKKIIEKYDLYPKLRSIGKIDIAMDRVRRKVQVSIKKQQLGTSYKEPTSFEISYEDEDPLKARNITAEFADLYLQYNFKLRQLQAAGTSRFLEGELEKMKKELRQWEDRVRQFKEKHAGLLPEQMETNYRILDQLQQQLDSLNTTLQKTKDRKIIVQSRLSRIESYKLVSLEPTAEGALPEKSQTPPSLEEMRWRLEMLKSRYSSRHPDVIKLEHTVARMEREQEEEIEKTNVEGSSRKLVPLGQTRESASTKKRDLLIQLRMIDKEIALFLKDIEKTEKQKDEYRSRVEKGPKIEAVYVDLRRGYEQASDNYKSLLRKKLDAEMAENLEQTQKGEQFKILNPASLPHRPYRPKIPRVLAMGFMLAVGSGFGLAILLEHLDQSFWSRKEVESVLGLPVLVSVPIIQTDRDHRWSTIKKAVTVCILLAMSSTLLVALFILWKRNPNAIPLPFL